MADPTGTNAPDESDLSERFRKLPGRTRLEDTIPTQDAEPAPDLTMGRDPEQDFMLRNAGG